ncbi:MAG: hypothetical protein ACYC6P_12500 [Ignavibacteriaceae bacterium]
MYFEIIEEIQKVEVIAVGNKIREIDKLKREYEEGRWRKLKGIASVRLRSGLVVHAELYWSEAHGIGKKDIKIKN